jgi:uncharacterized membrane protein YbhN (UPF0104 family)
MIAMEPLLPSAPAGRRAALLLVAAVVLVVGAALAIGKAASYARLLHELRGAQMEWLAVALAGELLAYAGYVVAYRETAAADGGPRFSPLDSLRIVAAGFGALVVATGAGTLAVDYWAMRRAGVTPPEALARVIAINTLEWAVLTAGAVGAAIALLLGVDRGAPRGVLIPWLVIVPLLYAIAFWVTSNRRYARLAAAGGGRIRRLFAACVRGVKIVRVLPPAAYGGTAVYWAGDLLCLWGGLRAFGIELGFCSLLLAYATGYLVAVLPLPAGGAGGVDAAMTYALTLVGVPLAPALLGTVAYRLFNFWLPVVPALAVLPTVRRIGRPAPQSS